MGLDIKINKKFLTKVRDDLKTTDFQLKKGSFLLKVAQLLNSSIQRRVQEGGIGVSGLPMKRYSDEWSDFRQKNGRQISFRDLTFEGHMWQSLTTTKVNRGVKMFFGGEEDKTKAEGNQLRAKFFGLSHEERAILKKSINKFVKKIGSK